MGVADLNRHGTGVSMGAVWGDYDNDGFDDLLVYRYGRARALPQRAGAARSCALSETAGLPRWVNANSATWLDYDRDGRLDLFIAGYWPDDVEPVAARPPRGSCRRASSTPTNGGRKYLLRNTRRRHVRGRDRGHGHRPAGAGRWRWWRRTCWAPAIPISSSPTTTACRSCTPTRAGKRFVDVAADGRRRPDAEERHERVARRRLQRRPARPSTRRTSPNRACWCRATTCGCRPAHGRRRGRRPRRSRTWRQASASTWAGGAGARSSAT